ncbi:MAG TPA: helix-turn-helix domain-containing protein [Anaerolineales bacterium]|nr:helix-turn-helix domain-containing protein [Anaerolineales bacterium]
MNSKENGGNVPAQSLSHDSFQTFGDLLRYLRRREHLTQLELSIAVGYSDAQITRLEKNQRRPDVAALKALFIPALRIENEPELITRFLELAESARQEEAPAHGIAPYKGLLFFDESDSELFFGREDLTAHLVERVMDLAMDRSTRFLTVVGASGSGKSSLMRAGLAVALQHLGWDVHIFTPTADPMRTSEAILNPIRSNDAERVLILVDQFEEVFTLCHDEMERIAFIEKLVGLAQDGLKSFTVVIALRADFYSHCAQYPLLRQMVASDQEYIGQMNSGDLRRAIEEPAKRGGWEFEPGLVDVLLHDIGAQGTGEPEPGALPLLSHALLATWERRRGRTLTLNGYRASGGVRGAIAETAESVFADQLNQTQQELARDVFLRLTELGEGTEDTRRRAALSELVRQSTEATQLRAVLNTLAEARLVTLNEDSAEVAHEALIREWHRLHEWLTQDREGLLLHRHLTESAHEWEARGHDPSELYRGARLAQVREWALVNGERLNAAEQAFLTTSIEQEQHDALEREAQRQRELEAAQRLAETERARAQEQSSSVKRLRQHRIFLASALIIATIAAVFAGIFANRNSTLAVSNAEIASTAQANEAMALQERQTAQQQALISSVRELSSAAEQNLEIDPERSILLASEAVNKTYKIDQTVLPEAEEALHRAVQASRVELTLRGHTDTLWSAVFSQDGTKIATASLDGMAKIWDAATGKELLRVKSPAKDPKPSTGYFEGWGWFWYATFSPDGKYLATADGDGIARIWDAVTGEELLALEGHSTDVYHIEFSPDGSRLVTVSPDGLAILWDALTGERLLTISEDSALYWAVFSPDGSQIAIANYDDGWVSIWDAGTGERLLTLPHPDTQVDSVAYSPDGSRLVTTSNDQTVRIWDSNSGKELLSLYGYTINVTNAAYSPDGTRIATVVRNSQVKIWDAETGQEFFTIAAHSLDVLTVAFSPDGNRIVTASRDGTAKVWNISSSREFLTLVNGPMISSEAALAYNPDGIHLATAYSDPIAKVWDLTTGEQLLSLVGHTENVNFIAYNFDGTRVATASEDGTAKLWDAKTGKELLTLSGHKYPVVSVAFSPDGSRIATASQDLTAKVWDAQTGRIIFTFDHPDWVTSVVFNPDGEIIATTGGVPQTATTTLWDAITGKELFSLLGHTDLIEQIAFSPDGTRLATASRDGSAKVWDAVSGKELFTFWGHDGTVFSVAFSPDGKTIATASADKTAKLWDALTGKELLTLNARDGLTSVAFSPDGSQLAVSSRDGTARIYLLKIEDLLALAKQRVTRSLTTEECQQYLHTATCPSVP